MKQFFLSNQPFNLEMGGILPELKIAYYTYGTLNEEKSNVLWICHTLTVSADAKDWSEMIKFLILKNILLFMLILLEDLIDRHPQIL